MSSTLSVFRFMESTVDLVGDPSTFPSDGSFLGPHQRLQAAGIAFFLGPIALEDPWIVNMIVSLPTPSPPLTLGGSLLPDSSSIPSALSGVVGNGPGFGFRSQWPRLLPLLAGAVSLLGIEELQRVAKELSQSQLSGSVCHQGSSWQEAKVGGRWSGTQGAKSSTADCAVADVAIVDDGVQIKARLLAWSLASSLEFEKQQWEQQHRASRVGCPMLRHSLPQAHRLSNPMQPSLGISDVVYFMNKAIPELGRRLGDSKAAGDTKGGTNGTASGDDPAFMELLKACHQQVGEVRSPASNGF